MNIAATILYLVLFINAFNFLDGADGIAAGVTAVIAIAYLLLPSGVLRAVGSADAWALLGACAGFLLFNFPPAKIFLGDSGSSVLGFTVALLGLELHRANGPGQAPLLFPLLVASVAILDVILAVVRRLRHGRSPLQGDRRHFYDLLRNTGWPARRIALTCYALTGALVTAGLATLHRGFMLQLVTYLLVTGVLLAIGASLGSLRGEQTHQSEPAESEAFWREASASRLRQKA
jgi:UDP-GlcNAc:undecaprenyl-phosphate GlcNAc-1-phosphate transferase